MAKTRRQYATISMPVLLIWRRMANGRAEQDWTYGPSTSTSVWQDERGAKFALELTLMGPLPDSGRIECVAVSLRSIPRSEMPDAPDPLVGHTRPSRVLSSHLRAVRLDEKVGMAKRKLVAALGPILNAQAPPWAQDDTTAGRMARTAWRALPAVAADAAPGVKSRPRRKREQLDDDLLREVGRIYMEASASGRNTGQAVREHFGRPQSTTNKWIGKARSRGFIGMGES